MPTTLGQRLSPKDRERDRMIEESLTAGYCMFGFPKPLETLYTQRRHVENRRQFIAAALFSVLLYCCFGAVDIIFRPELMTQLLEIRLVFVSYCAAGIATIMLRPANMLLPGLFSFFGITLASLCAGMMMWLPGNPIAVYEAYVFILMAVIANIALPLSAPVAALSTLCNFLIACLFVLGDHDLVPHEQVSPLIYLAATSALTVFANNRLNNADRRAFLFYLREKTYAEYLSTENEALSQISRTDTLTGIANRRSFNGFLQKSWQTALERNQSLALLMIDIDRFKQFNDNYGHPAGDECLQLVAGAIAEATNSRDELAARLGGEEFAIILSGGNAVTAKITAERIHARIAALSIANHEGVDGRLTVSVGIAVMIPRGEAADSASLIAEADRALYAAKQAGRNRTEFGAQTQDGEQETQAITTAI
ncbi:GGDEF domain-containing protein [Martelella alba]|uniref:diguanylate cyclase n=1 Tax=Martelella alba TaxID=2590451 RepID=A0A506UJP2_9HYPH|nr:diguanylate cyclase [Martelella alba]TPW33551.1 GGDEF domain-containing protein [Martelella alba]